MEQNAKNRKKNTSNRKFRLIGGLIILSVFALIFISDHGIFKRLSLEKKKSNLISRIKFEEKKKDSLYQRIKRLYYDTLEIERIAREKYGMLKDGEEVYFIKEEKKEE